MDDPQLTDRCVQLVRSALRLALGMRQIVFWEFYLPVPTTVLTLPPAHLTAICTFYSILFRLVTTRVLNIPPFGAHAFQGLSMPKNITLSETIRPSANKGNPFSEICCKKNVETSCLFMRSVTPPSPLWKIGTHLCCPLNNSTPPPSELHNENGSWRNICQKIIHSSEVTKSELHLSLPDTRLQFGCPRVTRGAQSQRKVTYLALIPSQKVHS